MIENYILYFSIAFSYIVSPGPAVMLAINYGLVHDLIKSRFMILGNTTGLAIIAILSSLSIGVLASNSPMFLMIISLFGAVFFLYKGVIILLKIKKEKIKKEKRKIYDNNLYSYKDGVILALTNPKPIIFFSSIFPRFIKADSSSTFSLSVLILTFLSISFISLNAYSFLSKKVLGNFLTPKFIKYFDIFTGIFFILLSVYILVDTFK